MQAPGLKIILPEVLDVPAAGEIIRRALISLSEGYSGIIISFHPVTRIQAAAADLLFREIKRMHLPRPSQKILITDLSPFAAHLALLYGLPVKKDSAELDASFFQQTGRHSEEQYSSEWPDSGLIDASLVRYAVCPHCENKVPFGVSRTRKCPFCGCDLRMSRQGGVIAYERL